MTQARATSRVNALERKATGVVRGPLRVVHIISGLGVGGAEMMLYKLLRERNPAEIEPLVISLSDVGRLGAGIMELGVPVECLHMSLKSRASLFKAPAAIWRLRSLLKTFAPHVVQTWMYHADLIGGGVSRLTSRAPVIWNIRASDLETGGIRRSTLMILGLCARLSHSIPAKIVCCSIASGVAHGRLGYAAEKFETIPNGFELDRYTPDAQSYREVREEIGARPDTVIIGLFGRYHPMKGHRDFLTAAAMIRSPDPDHPCHFVLCGEGIDEQNEELSAMVRDLGVGDRVHLLGRRSDMPRLAAGIDVLCSASLSEGFPNVVGEAMAAGVPCVVTDAGDSAVIVGDTGVVVPPGKPSELAAACTELINMERQQRSALGARARDRVVERFDIKKIAKQYEELYSRVAAHEEKS